MLFIGTQFSNLYTAVDTPARGRGQFSSTRAEVAAIAMALRSMEQTQSLVILVDNAAALQRLAWCRSSEFRPSPRRLKDVDIMHDIISLIRGRQDAGPARRGA